MSSPEAFVRAFASKYPQVALVGVTKGQPVQQIESAIAGGLRYLGNNYVQEGVELLKVFEQRFLHWSFIGRIQSRKVRSLGSYHLVQSVDRFSVAEELSERALTGRGVQEILIQVNIGEEATKAGISSTELAPFMSQVGRLAGVRIKGLLVFPPPLFPVENRRPYFRKARKLFDASGFRSAESFLSAGTSEDYEIAIDEGANMVRLGEILFGKRIIET